MNEELHDPVTLCTPQQLNLTVKTQWIRALDVVLIGPLMVGGGVALSRTDKPLLGILLGALGIGTILFNGRNWWLVHQATRRLNG